MTELEALRRVAEAAQKLLNDVVGAWGYAEDELRQAIGNTNYGLIQHRAEWLQHGLDALPAPAAEPEGEVVEVVADVFGDNDGFFVRERGHIPLPHNLHIATIRARVPLPRVPEVVGEVG